MSNSAPSAPEWLLLLVERARREDGQPPFSDQSLAELRTDSRRLIAQDELAAALVCETEAEFVVDPAWRGRGLGTAMLERLLGQATGELLIWAHGDHPAARALARSHGLEAVRELLHLRLDDLGDEHAELGRIPAGMSITTFRIGRDEDSWLELNARAFADHPEQGRLGREELEQLLSEPWFRADDFLMLWRGQRLLGYCWLKVEGGLGEFYVVGVDPEQHGHGLGRRLTEAGLARLRQRGTRAAHLYVEAGNGTALGLYRSLGFRDSEVDLQYRAAAG